MEGWLKKKGENIGTLFWKDRWFKEEDGRLVYYTNQTLSEAKGHIDLKSIQDVRPRMDNFGFSSGSGFEIVTEGRVYCLWASKEAEQLAWVNGLLARLDKKKKFVASGDEWMASLRSVARAVVITITNRTNYTFERDNFKLHGPGQEWKKFPPEKMLPNTTYTCATCSSTLLTGTCASVTFRTKIDLDDAIVWLRWHNPFRKLTASKKKLFEAPSRLRVTATDDLSESAKLMIDSDIYKIHYEIQFDPQLAHSTTNLTSPADRSTITHESSDGAIEGDWIDVDKESTGPKKAPAAEGQLGEVVQTSYGVTKYHSDWIPVLKSAPRSVLITIINDTKYQVNRLDWTLKRGLWRAIPAEQIAARAVAMFGTSSHGAGVIGFRSGTIGSVTYSIKFPSGDYLISFDWTNHLIWGIHNSVAVTSNVADPAAASINVLTASNDDPSCEITFTIGDGTQSEPVQGTIIPAPPPAATSSDSNESQPQPAKVIRKTVPKRIQEQGATTTHTSTFMDLRRAKTEQKKAQVSRAETDLEMVAFNLAHRALKKQQEGGFFNSLFNKDPTLEEEAENVAASRTPAPLSTAACPITGKSLALKEDKKYCYICGRLVHRSVVVNLPYPPTIDTKDLKKVPPIIACIECNDILTQAERPRERREKLAKAAQHPMLTIHQEFFEKQKVLKDAMQDLRKFIVAKDKDAPVVLNKINSLLQEIDGLQMKLYALNETSRRPEQKLNNTLALYISNWKDDLTPEITALKEAISPPAV